MRFLLAAVLIASTANAQQQDSVVAGRITTLFHALGAGDSAELRRTVTGDFYLFEHARWNLDTLLRLMPAVHGRHWSPDHMRVTVAEPLAYVTYENHSDGAPIYWLESAVLRHTGGTWRIAFMHSTRVPLPTDTAGLTDWQPMGNGGYLMRLVGSTPPSSTEMTAFRVRYPANFRGDSGVHYHLGTEHATILKGTLMVGFGDTADYSKMKAYGPGSFLVIPAGTHHYEVMRGEVEAQIDALGPMSTVWLNHTAPSMPSTPLPPKTQPGFYRMMLGAFEVTALNDGVVFYPTARVLPTATADQIKRGLYENGLGDPVGMSYNAFLINTGEKLVLIDVGTGGKLDDQPEFHGAGHLLANLRAAGYRPEQVDEIYITHRGQDHVGGLTIGQERAFPNATVRVPNGEFDRFLDPVKSAALLARVHNDSAAASFIRFTQGLFEPYIKAGKFQTFDADGPLVPGIRALATHGHTPGHTSYVVESQGQTLIVMGDLVLMGALQFEDPSLGSSFDADPKAAAEQRLRVFKLAADSDYWVAAGHLSFPAIGHIRAGDDRFFWVPANYTTPQ